MRNIIIILLTCTVLLLLGYSGYRAYELWKEGHWMTLAREFADKKDGPNEYLCLEQVLKSNPRDVEACRMMADLAESAHSSGALIWRQKVLELDPTSTPDRLALAQTAIMDQDIDTASSTLAGLDDAGKKTPTYWYISGQLALMHNNLPEAEADFAEAVRLDPFNLPSQLGLAVVELHSSNSLDIAEARISLRRISVNETNSAFRVQAKRELVMDALRSKDESTAYSFSRELLQETNATFADDLLNLEVLKSSGRAEYGSSLLSCEREAANSSAELYQMNLWLLEHNLNHQALAWLQSLPARIQTNQPAALLIAQNQMLEQDWTAELNALQKENWGPLEFTRLAYMSRALREQGLDESSKAQWDVALRAANGEKQNLIALFRLAAAWNWQNEAQQILWTIVNTFPEEQWAAQDLAKALYTTGSTRPLMQLFSIQLNRNPDSLDAKNNLAITAMLLNAQEMKPYTLTREVYGADPTNASYACTYAFSLYLQGKSAAALKIMQSIPAQSLNNNSTAGYYGMILASIGDKARAGAYLRRSVQGPLLPEERAMFRQAMSGL